MALQSVDFSYLDFAHAHCRPVRETFIHDYFV